ncbi:hypothetical protein BRAS3843_1650015 [Bradyrhizobium sp. STM 3843]|nr:hypothetical protein BRAS3843_1650015 [Bradyrhizobium sp. STM 3843]
MALPTCTNLCPNDPLFCTGRANKVLHVKTNNAVKNSDRASLVVNRGRIFMRRALMTMRRSNANVS